MINFNQKNLKGIIPILYTFFNKNNSIDIELMKDQISLIVKQQSNGIACLGLASEVNKLSLKEKIKIIELISACCPRHFIKATTIQATTLKDYKKLIDVAKVNNTDWIILQPLLRKNTKDIDSLIRNAKSMENAVDSDAEEGEADPDPCDKYPEAC